MLLDNDLRATWKTYAKLPVGPIVGAINLCNDARTTKEHYRALYQGAEWARVLQACLVAWAATDSKDHAATAIQYFTALLDDLDSVGDHRGGDDAVRRDHGYSIRNLGPYAALAYDWLNDKMSPELKARARKRWKAWLDWYAESGYRARSPGSNYHAGYLFAATTIAIAQAGEAGADGTALWGLVADELWGKDMRAALTTDGVLAGGNWPEGWQYGPLSVAEYSLGARIMKGVGVDVPGITQWLSSLMRHHVYSLSPGDTVYATGDTEAETANLQPHVLTLSAIAIGDSTPDDKKWARGELARLKIVDRDFFLYSSLAAPGDKPEPPPRAAWPTWYLSANTGTLYARTRWDDDAIWFVSECHATIDTDHRHPSAGTFALSRGKDDVIVDPSPYGSQSTLTGNAPTVASAQLPADYIPSQGAWSEKTGYDFVTQRASGVVAVRCDYSDQYKFQERRSDIPEAIRDMVLVPTSDGKDAVLVVIDRARTGDAERGMNLRFRTPGHLALEGSTATSTVGSSKLVITSATPTKPSIGVPSGKDCYKEGIAKGRCDAARFPVTDYRVEVPGPKPTAVHVISATGAKAPASSAKLLTGDGWAGVQVRGVRDATIVWRTAGGPLTSYIAAPGTNVILDGADGDITATKEGDACKVKLAGKGLRAVVAKLDEDCKVTADPEAAAASAIDTKPRRAPARSPRSGCCGAEAAPGQAFAMTGVVFAILVLRRRRR